MELCIKCRKNPIPLRGEPADVSMCRPCWRRAGRPSDPSKVCKTCQKEWISYKEPAKTNQLCRQCWLNANCPDENGKAAPTCTTPNCGGYLRTKGVAWRNNLCMRCFQQAAKQTWSDVCGDRWPDYVWPDTQYMPKTLFIGNLPYDWEVKDVTSWIHQIAPYLHTTGKPDCFWVHPKRGRHWAWNKVFKRFAFVDFDLVCSACKVLDEATTREFFFFQGREADDLPGGRRVAIIYPAVVFNSLEWMLDDDGSTWKWRTRKETCDGNEVHRTSGAVASGL